LHYCGPLGSSAMMKGHWSGPARHPQHLVGRGFAASLHFPAEKTESRDESLRSSPKAVILIIVGQVHRQRPQIQKGSGLKLFPHWLSRHTGYPGKVGAL
jgi:hypothetical protein